MKSNMHSIVEKIMPTDSPTKNNTKVKDSVFITNYIKKPYDIKIDIDSKTLLDVVDMLQEIDDKITIKIFLDDCDNVLMLEANSKLQSGRALFQKKLKK